MKKLFCAAVAAIVALTSCSKNETVAPEVAAEQPQVRITLESESKSTRTFFDDNVAGEVWENKINTLHIYVYSPKGDLIVQRIMTSDELAAKSAKFALPRSLVGEKCTFFVVANAKYFNVLRLNDIEKGHETTPIADYNGTFADVSTSGKRAAGFVMEGKSVAKIAADGEPTTVGVTLRRTVAKIAVRASIDPALKTLLGGSIAISSIKIEGEKNLVQTGDKGLFYIYESPSDKPVTLIVAGNYCPASSNGDPLPRTPFEYKITLKGAGDGTIKRNGYYRINAVVKDFSGSELAVNFVTENWDVPIVQEVNCGRN